jgi:hypothetical protein
MRPDNQLSTSPKVTEMHVVPVAGHDAMLLNLSGAHAPFFTRNLVILRLEDARSLVVGAAIGTYNDILNRNAQKLCPIAMPADADRKLSTSVSPFTRSPRSRRRCSTC